MSMQVLSTSRPIKDDRVTIYGRRRTWSELIGGPFLPNQVLWEIIQIGASPKLLSVARAQPPVISLAARPATFVLKFNFKHFKDLCKKFQTSRSHYTVM